MIEVTVFLALVGAGIVIGMVIEASIRVRWP